MSDIKLKLKVKHVAGGDPGVWDDSILKLYIKGSKDLITKVEKAIREALIKK